MPEVQSVDPPASLGPEPSGVAFFASQVVSLMADRGIRSAPRLREPLVTGLVRASLAGTRDAFAELLGEVRMARISLAALADIYIPMAAQRMGQAWLDDEMSWLDVSIGVGRMQSLLRELGNAWSADQAADAGYGSVLMIIPDQEQHTLGPMVATGQMRRYGVSVCLRIAPSFAEMRQLVATRHFDGIMISVATREKLQSVAKTVQFLKSMSAVPILVGGAVLEKVENVAHCTGADFCSNDISAALESIGLKFDAFCVLRRA